MNTIYGTEPNPSENSKSFKVALNESHNVTLTYKDPFGLIEASTETFPLPEELQGNFTSAGEAHKAINAYKTKNPQGPVVKTNKKAA